MNKHEWRCFACVAALAGAAACDPADRIRNGMREGDVLKILGKPARTVEDAAKFRDPWFAAHIIMYKQRWDGGLPAPRS